MKAFRIRKIATVVFVLFAVLISLVFVLDSAAAEAENDVAVGSKGEIDVWLIAGQSNAVGFGSDGLSAQYLEDKRYTEGFDNVLFWGKYESTYNPEAFVPVTVGLGKQSATNTTTVGAEIGMAAALDGNGRMNAIIKRAVGGSYLYPTTYSTVSQNSGTWTSPSYLEKYSIDTEGNKLGNLYTEFIQTTKDGIDMLIADGYTPVIKGVWYMQGEAETPTQLYADAYAELLTMLIGDMREDLGEIVNKDLSNLPFVMGKITRNPEYDIPEFIDTVTAAQLSVASAVANAYIVDTTGMPQIDGWHYTADSQHEIGVQFINTVINSSGKYSVTASGTGVSLSGGGAKSVGDEVTVTFTSLEGYELSSVAMKVGAGEAVDITGALVQDTENLSVYSYTFVMPTGNVAFEINATDLNAESTEYGLIPSMFTDAEKYPFILFKSGEFVYAFDDWCDFVNSNSIAGCTLLLRRDYDTTESSGSPWALCHSDELTIDLGNHIFTRGMYHMFQCLGRDEKVYTSTITVKNGTLKSTFSYVNASGTTTGASPLVVFNNSASSTTVDKFNFIFDGVTFDVSSGRGIVASFTDGTCGTDNTITLNNCTIYRGASTSAMTLFALAETSGNKNDIKVTINGGKLVADTLSKLTFATYDVEREAGEGSPDSLTLNTDSSGNKFTVELPLSAGTPTQMFTFTKGGYAAVKLSDDGTTAKYTLEYLGTPYGNIDVKYASAADYPFVLFKNGAVLTAFSNWKTFIDSTMYNSADYKTGCTLLLRRDYSTSEASGNPWALSYIKDIVIDLGGNVFTRGNNHMFQAYGHGNAAGNTSIKVINGTLKAKFYKDNGTTSATPLIVFNNSADSTADDAFAFTFEGVTFDVSEGRGIVACYTDGTYGTKNTMILNNCTIYRGTSTSSMTLFALTESSGNKNDVNIIINGGKFVANSFSKLTLATFSAEREAGKGSPDSLKFGAYNGKYVSFVTKSGNAAPSYSFVTVNGSQVSFADVSTSENAIYQLGEDIKTDYGYIPYAYSNIDNCPVIIFKNGTYYGNNTVFSAAYSTAIGQTGDSADTVV
ncbi:MAG: hypothetical protein IJD79_09915, partial [Clostridia bacterium]|nr:hypothetical protein [Clostridia bacterium]